MKGLFKEPKVNVSFYHFQYVVHIQSMLKGIDLEQDKGNSISMQEVQVKFIP